LTDIFLFEEAEEICSNENCICKRKEIKTKGDFNFNGNEFCKCLSDYNSGIYCLDEPDGNININNCKFFSCATIQQGGGIYFKNCYITEIKRNTFIEFAASNRNGSGVYEYLIKT